MKHPGDESDYWWFIRVILCKLQSQLERACTHKDADLAK